jgi:aspartate/methionine/tyrosine aminotransferase
MDSKKQNISDFFQLRPVKSAKVSEISEATAGSALPVSDRVNFHIGHPVQDENLSRLYFKLVTGLDSPPQDNADKEEIENLADSGWESNQQTDILFLKHIIDKSTPYLPRGGYSSQSPGKLIDFINLWLGENQSEPLAYSFGLKSAQRECMLNTGGVWESLRVFLQGISTHLIHLPARIFLFHTDLPDHLRQMEKLNYISLNEQEDLAYNQLLSSYKDDDQTPGYLILGTPLSENSRRQLRLLSLRKPLRFVEINQSPNHLSLAREARMQNRVIRILSAGAVSPLFSLLSVDIILGTADLINVMETTQFELKGTPSVTEVELVSYLLERDVNNHSPDDRHEYPSDMKEHPNYIPQKTTFDIHVNKRVSATDQVINTFQRAIKTSNRALQTIQKYSEIVDRKISTIPSMNSTADDYFASISAGSVFKQFIGNVNNKEWLADLSKSFVQSFANHHPEYKKDRLLVVSGSARTALGMLGFHCGIHEVITADLGWTYEHCFRNVKTVPLTSDLSLDEEGIISRVENRLQQDNNWKKYGAVILNNPQNASGHIAGKEKISKLLHYLLANEIQVIDDLSYQNVLPVSTLNGPQSVRQVATELVKYGYLASEKLKHLITVHSLSKTDCFAGARLSVVEILHPDLYQKFDSLNQSITPNHMSILLAYLFYRNDNEDVNTFWLLRNTIFSNRMTAMENALKNLPAGRNPYQLTLNRPQGSMYPHLVVNNLPKGLSLDWLSSNLATRGIGLIPLTTFARTAEGYDVARESFRLTLGGAESEKSISRKMRRLLIDLNRLIANEEARYNLKKVEEIKRTGLNQINFHEFKELWESFTMQIKVHAKDAFTGLMNKYAILLGNSTAYDKLFEDFIPHRLAILHNHLQDHMEAAEDFLKIVKGDQRHFLIKNLAKELYKDNIDNRTIRFRRRLFDRTVHPTQMYALKVDILFQKIVEDYLTQRSFSQKNIKKTGEALAREFFGLDVPITSIDEADELVIDLKMMISAEKILHWGSSYSHPLLLSFWGDWDGSNRPSGQGHRLIAAAVMENLTQLASLIELITKYDSKIELDPDLQRELSLLPENQKKFWNLLNQITRLTNQLEKRYRGFVPLELSYGRIKKAMMRMHLSKDPLTALWQHNDRLEKRMYQMRQQRRESLEYYFALNKRLRKTLHSLIPDVEKQLQHPEVALAFGSYRDILKRFVLTPRIHQRIITSEDPFTIDTTVHNMIEINEIAGKYGNPGMVMALQVSMSTEPEAFIQLDRKIHAERENRLREDPQSTIPPIWIVPLFEDTNSIENLGKYLDRLWSYATQSRKIDQAQAERFTEMICEIFIAGSDLSQQIGQPAAASLYGKAKFTTMCWLAERGLVEDVRMKFGSGESIQRQGGFYNLDSEQPLFIKSRENTKRLERNLKESSVKSIDFAKSPLRGVLSTGDLRTFQSTISEKLRFLSTKERADLYHHLIESQKFHDNELARISEPQIDTRLQFKERGLEELELFICGTTDKIYDEFLQLCTKNFRQILYGKEEDVVGIHVISHFISRALPELRDRPTVRPGQQVGKARGQQIIERLSQTLPMCKHGSMLRAIGHNRAQTMVLGINQLTTGVFRSLKELIDQYSGPADALTLISNQILPNLPVRGILQTLYYYHDPALEYLREMEKAFPAGNSSFLYVSEDTDSIASFIGLFQKEYLRRYGLDIGDFFNGNVFNPDLLPTLRPEISVLMQENIFNSDLDIFCKGISGKPNKNWIKQVEDALQIPQKIKLWRKQVWNTLREPIYGQVNSFVELALAINAISQGSGQGLQPVTTDISEILRLGSHVAKQLRGTGDDSLRQFLTDVVQLLTQLPGSLTEIPLDIIRALRDVERIVQIEEQVLSGKEQDIERFYLLQIARLTGENG